RHDGQPPGAAPEPRGRAGRRPAPRPGDRPVPVLHAGTGTGVRPRVGADAVGQSLYGARTVLRPGTGARGVVRAGTRTGAWTGRGAVVGAGADGRAVVRAGTRPRDQAAWTRTRAGRRADTRGRG